MCSRIFKKKKKFGHRIHSALDKHTIISLCCVGWKHIKYILGRWATLRTESVLLERLTHLSWTVSDHIGSYLTEECLQFVGELPKKMARRISPWRLFWNMGSRSNVHSIWSRWRGNDEIRITLLPHCCRLQVSSSWLKVMCHFLAVA